MIKGSIAIRTLPAIIAALLIIPSCASRKNLRHLVTPIPERAGIGIIVDAPNSIKNAVLARFMARGFAVKAVNASDFYMLKDVYDIRDFRKVSYSARGENLLSLEKAINNLYKLHIYSFEVSKAESLAEMKNKWNVQYLILLDLKDWEDVSWGRAIDLRNNEVVWIDNYPTTYSDTLESVIDHFIQSMTKR